MKVAVIQLDAGVEKDPNIKKAFQMVQTAIRKKARFILLPEVFVYRGKTTPEKLREVAESVPGPLTEAFANLAKEKGVYILLGSIFERSSQEKVYNTSVLINPKGKVQAKYRKMHLFDAKVGRQKVRESKTFLKGRKAVLTSVGKFKVGLSVCFDLRFSELYLKYAQAGADILVVPSAFTHKTGQAHWKTLLRARAIEHQCYVLAPNQTGKDGRGVLSYGHSMIIHPWGNVLAEASESQNKIIYATLNKKELNRVRAIVNMKK